MQSTESFTRRVAMAALLALALAGCSKSSNPVPPQGSNGPAWTQTAGPSSATVHALFTTSTLALAGTDRGIFRSTDQGASWSLVLPGLAAHDFAQLGSELFVGTTYGVWKSADDGRNWSESSTGLTPNVRVFAVEATGSVLIASVANGVFRSTDGGAHWTDANFGLPSLAIVPALLGRASECFAGTADYGIFRSTDAGQTWLPANDGMPATGIQALHEFGGSLFAGTSNAGVYQASGPGLTWDPISQVLPTVFALTTYQGVEYAATDVGVYRRNTGGNPWTLVSTGLPASTSYRALAPLGLHLGVGTVGRGAMVGIVAATWFLIGPPDADVIAVANLGGDLLTGVAARGIYRSTSSGQYWQLALPSGDIECFAIRGTTYFAGTLGGGVLRSQNFGATWSPVNTGLPSNASVFDIAATSGAVVIATQTPGGVWYSADDGDHWSLTNGLPANPQVLALAAQGSTLLAGVVSSAGAHGVYVSISGGVNWSPSNTGLPAGTEVLAIASTIGRTYLGTAGNGVFVSTNGGVSWSPTGLTSGIVQSIAASASQVAIVTTDGQVRRSTDGGASWSAAGTGFGKLDVRAVTAGNEAFFVATSAGVWKLAY